MDVFKKLVRVVYEFIEAFVISASIFVVVYLFLMQPHQVKGSSMFPTFKDQEYLLTDKVTYKSRLPKYGDVIVFKAPINENFDFIKRIIATAGQTVMVKGGHVYVNDKMLDEFYLPKEYTTSPGQFLHEGESYVVPDNSVMTFGDNRDHSSDSRDWGPVPLQNIVGRVFFRYWPSNVAGIIVNPVKAGN
jgi:signal peptidase I